MLFKFIYRENDFRSDRYGKNTGRIPRKTASPASPGSPDLSPLSEIQLFCMAIRGLWSVVVQREVPRPHRTIEALSEVAGEGGEGVERISYYTEILKTCQLTLVFSVLLLWRGWRGWRGCFFSSIEGMLFKKNISKAKDRRSVQKQPLHPLRGPALWQHLTLRLQTNPCEHQT